MGKTTGLAVADDHFVLISVDEQGHASLVSDHPDQEQAGHRLISIWLAGNPESTDPQQQQSYRGFADQVLLTIFNQVEGRKDLTLPEKLEHLRRIYGSNPR